MPKNRGTRDFKPGKLDPAREAWTRVGFGEAIMLSDPDDPENVALCLRASRSSVTIVLNQLTRPELDAVRTILNRAFDKAGPICDELDRRAQEAWENGDDSFDRSYRPVPQVHVRQRRESGHDSGIQGGPDGPAGGDGGHE